jgi:hypothetical protein
MLSAMDQKSRIAWYRSQRYGIIRRLQHGRLSVEAAERWVAAWEDEARRRHLDPSAADWWDPAWAWIADQRGVR